MDFYISNEEIDALKLYKGMAYEAINQVLVSNSEIDINLLSDESNKGKNIVSYSKENVKLYIDIIKKVYELMLKKHSTKRENLKNTFYRGTNISEIERIKNEPYIDRMLSVTDVYNIAKERFAAGWTRPAMLEINIERDIPYINVCEVLKTSDTQSEYIISPFTIIKEINEKQEEIFENTTKVLKKYQISLTKQDLEPLTQDEKNGLYSYVMNNADSIDQKLKEAVELEKINSENYENIRKLEQLLSKYEIENDKKDTKIDFDDIERINKQLDEIKYECSEIFKNKKDIINFVTNWKRNLILFLMAECKEIEEKYRVSYQLKNVLSQEMKEEINENFEKDEKFSFENEQNDIEKSEEKLESIENLENIESTEETENKSDHSENEIKETEKVEEKNLEETIIFEKIDENDKAFEVKKECDENISAVLKLIDDIKKLISKQQNHAKVAGNLGTTYSALNNGFEMKKVAETLESLVKNIRLKITTIAEETEDEEILKEKLEAISKVNIQISTLLNYLNNPKNSIGISNITRFDEMSIIEENELKRGIFQAVREIMGEAELKKLKDDLLDIESKTPIEKLMGIFTGKNKLDEIVIEQIEIRQSAIRKTLSQKLALANNYSIHEIVALMKMFVKENFDDELILEDVSKIEKLDKELRSNFVVVDRKVDVIIMDKEGKNLPIEDKKISKREALEIDTFRFLNKYGYDIEKESEKEKKYQDTMTNEISRIIEYINSSNIL